MTDYVERPTCPATGGKIIFESSAEAQAELERVQERRARGISRLEDPKTEQRVYPCFPCGGWHLSAESEPPAERPSRGRRRRPNQRRKGR